MNHYPHHIGDCLKDTAHFTLLEHGCYRRMLDVYYTREEPFKSADDAAYLIGAKTAQERKAVESVLRQCFHNNGGQLHQNRCDSEIAKYQEKAAVNRENGKRGGRPQGTQDKPTNNPNGFENETQKNPSQNQEPEPEPSSSTTVAKAAPPPCPHLEILALYRKHLPMGRQPDAELWGGTRAKHLQARWRENTKRQNLEWWEKWFAYIAESDFLTGKVPPKPGHKPFEIAIDWIVRPENFTKIHEGAYK